MAYGIWIAFILIVSISTISLQISPCLRVSMAEDILSLDEAIVVQDDRITLVLMRIQPFDL